MRSGESADEMSTCWLTQAFLFGVIKLSRPCSIEPVFFWTRTCWHFILERLLCGWWHQSSGGTTSKHLAAICRHFALLIVADITLHMKEVSLAKCCWSCVCLYVPEKVQWAECLINLHVQSSPKIFWLHSNFITFPACLTLTFTIHSQPSCENHLLVVKTT